MRRYCDQCRSEDSKCTIEAIRCKSDMSEFVQRRIRGSFLFVRPGIPCHPPIRASMGRFRIGVWQRYASAKGDGLLSALALALLRPILVVWMPAKRCWTQRPGLDLAGAAHIQPIAAGSDLMWERTGLAREREHDANLFARRIELASVSAHSRSGHASICGLFELASVRRVKIPGVSRPP